MGLWDKLKAELIDIIEWLSDDRSLLAYRFERHGNEIKNGAKLIVREGQVAVFVNEGKIADIFQPGTHDLTTQNLPILSTIMGWKYGFESPFKAEVIFVRTTQVVDLKWGTKNPIMLRCPEFGPIRLRAFGTYAYQVEDAGSFIKGIVGTDGSFTSDEITDQLRNIIVSRFTDKLGELNVPVLDMAANYDELGDTIHAKIGPEFDEYGIKLTKFLVENIALPPEVEKALDKRSTMGIIGDMNKYTQFQTAEAIPIAAANEAGGLASAGIGMGMGLGMAGNMMGAMSQSFPQGQQQAPAQAQSAPPAPPSNGSAPPPPPSQAVSKDWHMSIDGTNYGPYTTQQLQGFVATGQFTTMSNMWATGMSEWQIASRIPELAALFAPPSSGASTGAPPPPPA